MAIDFSFLGFTENATAVLNADNAIFFDLLAVIISLIVMLVIVWYIHYKTSKMNGTYKPFWTEPPFVKAEPKGRGGRR